MTRIPIIPFSGRDARFGPLLPTSTMVGYWIAIAAIVVIAVLSYNAVRAA